MPHPRKRSRRRRCCYALLALFLISVVARNSIARYAVVHLGSWILKTQIEVASIHIGLSSILIDRIRVCEPDSKDIQANVKLVAISLTPFQGIRRGVWAKQIAVSEPTLHVRFDRNGNLISKFPDSGESESTSTKIPVAGLLVKDATLVVHQVGKDPFAVENVDLAATFAEKIRLRVDVDDVLGGMIQLRAVVDAETHEGQSKLTLDGFVVDTARLVTLPLVPASANNDPLIATVSISISGDHPAGELDLRKHAMKAIAVIRNVKSQRLGKLSDEFQAYATNQTGKLTVRGKGDLVEGIVELDAGCDFAAKPLAATLSISASQVNVGHLASQLIPDRTIKAKLGLKTDIKVESMDGVASFTTSLDASLSRIHADGIPVSDIVGNVVSSGSVALADVSSLQGDINGSAESAGVNLDSIAKRFQLPASQGDIGFSANVHIPLAGLTKPNAASLDTVSLLATVNTADVSIGDFQLHDNTASLSVKNGTAIAKYSDATVVGADKMPIASFNATAIMPLDAAESLSTNLRFSLTPTSSLARVLGVKENACSGVISANAIASCRVGHAAQLDAWKAKASLVSRDLAFANELITNIDASLELTDGQIDVPPFEIQWRDNTLTFVAKGSVQEPITLNGQVAGDDIKLSDFAELASRFSKTPLPASGIADLKGNFSLAAKPLSIVASGSSSLRDAYYAQSRIGQANLTWSADLDGVQLRSSSNQFLGGTFDVVAKAQDLDWTKTIVEGRFRDIQASNLAGFVDRNLPITGSLDGALSVTSVASLDTLAGRAWVTSRGVSVHHLPLEITSANLSIQSSEITVNCEGAIADGRFQSAANSRLQDLITFIQTPDRNLSRAPIVMHGKLVDLPIESLTRHIRLPTELRTLGGTLNASFARQPAMLNGRSLADATASVSDLRLNRVRLSDRILGEATVYNDRVVLRRIDGRFADGRLSGKAEVRIASNPTGTFDFAANRVNLRRVSAATVPQPVSGSGTIQIRGRIGQVISGRADVSLSHGLFAGVSIPDAKFPIDWSYSQPSKVARWQCRAGMVSAGGGTVRVSTEGSFGSNLNMTTAARIERVDSSKLMQGKSVGAGIISGTVNLQAKRARSPKQFAGNYNLTLANVKTLEIPVLDQLPKMVSLSPSRPGQGEDGGSVRGRIAGGLVHVDELAIAQSNVQVLMTGNATLDGRLNFDLTASTQSNGPADQLLELADSPLMLAAPAPIALVAKANNLLKDRVIHVHVGGNAARPTMRLQPGKQLSQDAVQFFLKSSFGSGPLSIANQSSQAFRR